MVELLQRVALFEFAETVINGEERRSYHYLLDSRGLKGKERKVIS